MSTKHSILTTTVALLMLCTSARADVFGRNADRGAVIGGIAGAVIGNNSGSRNAAKGAAIGAASGLILGSIIDQNHRGHYHSSPMPVGYGHNYRTNEVIIIDRNYHGHCPPYWSPVIIEQRHWRHGQWYYTRQYGWRDPYGRYHSRYR
jgi:hypothetical protein